MIAALVAACETTRRVPPRQRDAPPPRDERDLRRPGTQGEDEELGDENDDGDTAADHKHTPHPQTVGHHKHKVPSPGPEQRCGRRPRSPAATQHRGHHHLQDRRHTVHNGEPRASSRPPSHPWNGWRRCHASAAHWPHCWRHSPCPSAPPPRRRRPSSPSPGGRPPAAGPSRGGGGARATSISRLQGHGQGGGDPQPEGPPPGELLSKDIVIGKGPAIKEGQTAAAHYVGVSWSTGQEFDASWDRGEPFPFPIARPGYQGWVRASRA